MLTLSTRSKGSHQDQPGHGDRLRDCLVDGLGKTILGRICGGFHQSGYARGVVEQSSHADAGHASGDPGRFHVPRLIPPAALVVHDCRFALRRTLCLHDDRQEAPVLLVRQWFHLCGHRRQFLQFADRLPNSSGTGPGNWDWDPGLLAGLCAALAPEQPGRLRRRQSQAVGDSGQTVPELPESDVR